MNSMPIVRNVFVAIALCLLASMAPAADQGPVTIGEVTLELPVLQDFSELPGLSEQLKGHWAGGAGEASVRIRYRVYPLERFRFSDPASVISLLEENYTNPRYGGTKDFRILRKELVPGPFGWAPYASIATATMPAENQVTRELFLLGGLLPDLGYSIEIEVAGHLEDVHRQAIDHFLRKGVTTNIEPWKAEWSMDEIRERWERDVPFDAKNLKKPLRTKHFLILTNSPAAGKLFGRKMEESYKKVQKMFPFDDVEGQRLMPVFIFKTREQYIQYYMHIANTSRSEAARSKGHAWRDYYATYYEAPNDPVHIHEATHQIFKNRLRLNGGGSWYQEGVAEYLSTSANQRKAFARRHAKDKKHIPFETFVQIRQLISNPHLDGENSYLQAASVTEFLREKFQKEKFPDFIVRVGKIERGNLDQIQEAIQEIYGMDLAGLEKEWVSYWSRR